jgi:hypothetical protein
MQSVFNNAVNGTPRSTVNPVQSNDPTRWQLLMVVPSGTQVEYSSRDRMIENKCRMQQLVIETQTDRVRQAVSVSNL